VIDLLLVLSFSAVLNFFYVNWGLTQDWLISADWPAGSPIEQLSMSSAHSPTVFPTLTSLTDDQHSEVRRQITVRGLFSMVSGRTESDWNIVYYRREINFESRTKLICVGELHKIHIVQCLCNRVKRRTLDFRHVFQNCYPVLCILALFKCNCIILGTMKRSPTT
jgi:hypothetical protein